MSPLTGPWGSNPMFPTIDCRSQCRSTDFLCGEAVTRAGARKCSFLSPLSESAEGAATIGRGHETVVGAGSRSRSPRTPRREEAVPAKAVALPPLPPPTTPPPMMPAPGFMWQQVPIPGAASAPAQGYPVSSNVWPAPSKWQQQQWPQRQSWSQRKGGWNKYKREDSQSSKPGDDSWRNIKEASPEEVRAAEERRAQAKEAEVDDDGDYLRWVVLCRS